LSPPDGTTVYLARGRTEEVPSGIAWLTLAEQRVEAGLALAKRRDDWRLGRWLAKRAVVAILAGRTDGIQPSDVEVAARSDGAPEARVPTADGEAIPLSISISHSEGVGLAVAAIGEVAVGCDVERITPHSKRFVEDYFTTEEREALDLTPPPRRSTTVTLIWSAKEAALKVLKQGLRADTRSVVVEVPGPLQPHGQRAGRWSTIQVRIPGDGRLEGYWLADDDFVWTIVGNQPLRLAV
jgi:4'-phosphopantetheinyl transferase